MHARIQLVKLSHKSSSPSRSGAELKSYTSPSRAPRCSRRTWQAGQLALHEVAEGLPRHIVVCAVAVHKVHGHVQRKVHVALKPKAGLKHKRQGAAPAEGKAKESRRVSRASEM